jgi:phosphoenolpyruvate synthase/pyruvate phosphate dikinase
MVVTRWLDDPCELDTAELGGKGASLRRLQHAGFPVPRGFIICAEGYRRWVAEHGLQPLIDELLATPDLKLPKVAREASAKLREAISAAPLPAAVAHDALAAYEQLRRARGSELVVAVRSSALSEDSAAASSAGLYETALNVRDAETLLAEIQRCYCCVWSPRAIQYRAFKGIDSGREAMAVVVMEMVPAQVAGVAFTVNPITGSAEEIVINASWGLGEGIVSGRVTPDNFVVRKRDLAIIERQVFEKELMIQPDPSGRSGTVAIAVPSQRATAPALDDAALVELARLCLAIERRFGGPQDIEWAMSDGRFYVLQSRAVTALH